MWVIHIFRLLKFMIKLLNQEYQLLRNDNDCFDLALVEEKLTDYFLPFDYLCGDYAYGKLRVKGFYESSNKNVTSINDIKNLDSYIKNYCAYGCKIFLLKKRK